MVSKTDIANRALSKVGHPRVSNVDTEDVKAARVISAMWDIVLNSMLAAYPWNFATTRAQLAKSATAPIDGYVNYYPLPSDFLSLLEIKGSPDYRIEANESQVLSIATDIGSPIFITYVRRVVDTGLFDPLFVEALSSRLAFEAVEELTQSNTKKQALARELETNIRLAYSNDSIQDPSVTLATDTWLLSREGIFDNDIDFNFQITS